ncbi:MAG: DUF11 domain-containing protein, partial [Clostridia bacterium]|nr:DUF11 domain-containing protein [Clostridia bacterium]
MKGRIFQILLFSVLIFACLLFVSCGGTDTEKESGEAIITVIKDSSHKRIRTAHPGEDITYTFTVENVGTATGSFVITDIVPQNTVYKGGDALCDGDKLTFSGEVNSKSKVTLSYTVTLTDDRDKLGTFVKSDSAEFMGAKIQCDDIYVARTFNEYDMQKLSIAVNAMRESEMNGKDLIKQHYIIAFSHANPIKEDAQDIANALFASTDEGSFSGYCAMVVPGLYGGSKIATILDSFSSEPTDKLEIADIFPGDVLLVLPSASDLSTAKMYVTDGRALYDVTEKTTKIDCAAVLTNIKSNEYFAVLRPSFSMESEYFYRSQPFYEGSNSAEKALISAADAFILRGDRMQYADTRLATDSTTATPIYRWERGKSPEDYTVDEIGYSNCTAFCHDAYLNAFEWDYGNYWLYNAPLEMIEYLYYLSGYETEEQKANVEQEFYDTLQFGDIVYFCYSAGGSHGMLYMGNGNLMHCSGSTYNTSTSNYYEVQEAAIRYQTIECLFTPGNSRYLFQTEKTRTKIYILRPFNLWNGEIPESTENRIENMKGIVAEKLSSHTLGQTANPGDLITYTFKIFNTNGYTVNLDVSDIIPENTTLVVNGYLSDKRSLFWTVDIAPGEEKLISYTVQISESCEKDSVIVCSDESAVGGVPVRSTPVFIGRTLTEAEQQRVKEIALALVEEKDEVGVSLANKIYRELFGIESFFGNDFDDLRSGIFVSYGSIKKIAVDGKYADMIAPTLYGGKSVVNSDRFLGERTRMLWERNLV